MKTITEEMLDQLREQVMGQMSPKRFRHTAAVEQMAVRLAELYCPEMSPRLRAAALLPDLTKEWSVEQHAAYCRDCGMEPQASYFLSPKTFHALTASLRIQREMPDYDDPIIVSAVRWHTTGHAGMTLTEKLIYLADYIDESRTYEGCVLLRRYFFGADPASMNAAERAALLRDTLIFSYDLTMRDLLADGTAIAEDTNRARNELIAQRAASLAEG